jgi:hypothetical protein
MVATCGGILNNDAKYEIPKSLEGQPENPSSLFAGAVMDRRY